MLTPPLAQEIADDTSRIIGFNVVITDRDGVVVGSGTAGRVGTFHEASVDVVATGRAATHTAEQARRLRGVKPGITLPIRLGGRVVGTVGITGSPSRVRPFGLVVCHQTELLLRESSLITSRLARDRAVAELIREIVDHDPAVVDAAVVEDVAGELGIDLATPRVALVVSTGRAPSAALVTTVRATFPGHEDIVGPVGRSHVAVLHALPASPDAVRDATGRAASLSQRWAALRVGVGERAAGVAGLQNSHADAMAALRYCAGPVADIADLRVPQLLATVGARARARFLDAVLAPLLAAPDAAVLLDTVSAWCEEGFHLVRAAAVLHVHRNTVVYRLGKIERLTGRDLRDRRVALAMYVACRVQEADPSRRSRST